MHKCLLKKFFYYKITIPNIKVAQLKQHWRLKPKNMCPSSCLDTFFCVRRIQYCVYRRIHPIGLNNITYCKIIIISQRQILRRYFNSQFLKKEKKCSNAIVRLIIFLIKRCRTLRMLTTIIFENNLHFTYWDDSVN